MDERTPPKSTAEAIPPEIKGAWAWLDRHNSAVTATAAIVSTLVTLAMAIFAYTSWQEVKAQRQQVYDQLRTTNTPLILPRAPEPFEFSADRVSTAWSVQNKGGVAEGVLLEFVVFDSWRVTVEEDGVRKTQWTEFRHSYWERYQVAIAPNDRSTSFLGVEKPHWDWLSKGLEDDRVRIYGYVRATYTTPPLVLGDDDQEMTSSESYWWNPSFKKWMRLGKEGHGDVELLIKGQKMLVADRTANTDRKNAPQK